MDKKTITMPKAEYDRLEEELKSKSKIISELKDLHESYLEGKVLIVYDYFYDLSHQSYKTELLEGTKELEEYLNTRIANVDVWKKRYDSLQNKVAEIRKVLRVNAFKTRKLKRIKELLDD